MPTKNGPFRSSFFGGYNREDVQTYVRSLENEIEAIKVLHQREKNELIRQAAQGDGASQGSDKRVEALTAEMQKVSGENDELKKRAEDAEAQLKNCREALARVQSEAAAEAEELRARLESGQGDSGEVAALREELNRAKEQAAEADALRAELNRAKEHAAQARASEIIMQAHQESEKHEQELMERMNAEVSNKLGQLFTAQRIINKYASQMKRFQESMKDLYAGMDEVAGEIPEPLMNYLDSAQLRQLEAEIHDDDDAQVNQDEQEDQEGQTD